MIRVLQVTATKENSKLLENMYKIEKLIKEIKDRFDQNNYSNYADELTIYKL